MKNDQIMIDLETLGQTAGSVIVALGAVKFSETEITDRFYARIDAASCEEVGMTIDSGAVGWWLQQSDAARLEITQPGRPLWDVLTHFAHWIGGGRPKVWGNGAAFDNVILADAYDRTKIRRPWHFSGDRCYRTVKALVPSIPPTPVGTAHNALDDATSQALHLMAIFQNTQSA